MKPINSLINNSFDKKGAFGFLILILLFGWFTACAPGRKLTPDELEGIKKWPKEAAVFFYQGDYFSLQQAYTRWKKLLSLGYQQPPVPQRFVETIFLLTLREKELAIPHHNFLPEAETFLTRNPSLKKYASLLQLIKKLPLRLQGYTDEIRWVSVDPKTKSQLAEKALTSSWWAYLYLHLFPFSREHKELHTRIAKTFARSPLIQYKLIISSPLKTNELTKFLEENPSFKEILYFLGEQYLNESKLALAEKQLQQARAIFPDSLNILILLSKINFRLEEFDECLKLNELAIALKSDFRDALLGKVMCLTYLDRSEEAIATAQKLLDLGFYYLGEAHYWMARNYHELKKLAEAWQHIEDAKRYLIGWNEIHALAGTIALDQNNLEEAEKNFKEALRLKETDCHSAFSLAKVYSFWQNWSASADYYQRAAFCFGQNQKVTLREINEIQSSNLDEARKERFIRKKKLRLARLRQLEATAYFNAAAGYFNSNHYQEALQMADKALSHPQLQEKAAELIKKIKEKK
jgi:tetratricopeptide (TPR) repeat protein